MLAHINSLNPVTDCACGAAALNSVPSQSASQKLEVQTVADILLAELHESLGVKPSGGRSVMLRIALEVERICEKSQRIQASGEERIWQMNLARHRLQKCLQYHKLGSQQGRVELHSSLAAMVYRHVAPLDAQLNFQGRYNLIEDCLQGFYIECLRAFRREHQLEVNYTPRTRLELAEYMAFTEQYAKRQIGLPGRNRQRLVVLRAQGFAKGLPPETSVDIELAVEGGKTEAEEAQSRSHAMQQVREQMVAEAIDPAEAVLRDRVIVELVEYLETQGQTDCVEYLKLKLQDLQACDIDKVMGLTSRQRDYLQQRFKYHVEKFARNNNWQLVHEWLGADISQKLGMTTQQWEQFQADLSPVQIKLLELKQEKHNDKAIAKVLKCTPKQVQKQWTKLLDVAFTYRNTQG
ncbi:MAG: HetZ-related protein [Microcoleaceae cyanobacterium]